MKISRFELESIVKSGKAVLSGIDITFKNISFRIGKFSIKNPNQSFFYKYVDHFKNQKCIMVTIFKKYAIAYKKSLSEKEIQKDIRGLF